MKKNCSTRSAFFNRRILIGVLLVIVSGVLALLAFGVRFDSQKFASLSKPKRGGAGVPLSKVPGEPLQGIRDQTPANYKGPRYDRRPVKPVYTRPLRDLPKIPPALAVRREVREPSRPKAPTDTPQGGFMQTLLGSVLSAPTPTGLSFDGVGVGLAGFVPSGNPPDTNGRVGAKQYVQWNNSSFAVFNKTTGALLFGPAAGNTLFQSLGGDCATHNDGDPVVSFDILAGRWVISQFVVGGSPDFSHQCVAVSQTEDATGEYYLYDFVTDSQNFVDYPKTGVWPDGYYMSGHVFNASGTAFLAGRIFVFERDQMLKGLPARQLQADLKKYGNKPQYGFLPSDLDSLTPPPPGEAAFVIGPHPTSVNRLTSARVAVTWGGSPRIRLTEDLIKETWGIAPCVSDTDAGDHLDCVPQPAPAAPTDYLDNLSFHLMYRLAYRNFGGNPVQESLVGNVTVPGASGRPPAHGAIRWYEFRNAGSSSTTPTVFQASTYDPDNAYRWMGSIAMDKDHNMALGYSKSSLSVIPSIFITGRLGTDPLNTLGAEAQVQAGAGVQKVTNGSNPGNRWGDYSAMTLDPVDQCTFYYTNEYLQTDGAFNWSTRIASFKFGACDPAQPWGTLTGTITSSPSGATLSDVVVTLSNGYAGATNGDGVYSFLVPPGTYTATAADADRNCTSASPANPTVNITSGGTTIQNFTMAGTSNLQENGVTIDGNGIINRDDCVNLNIELKNNGCANATGISSTLTTTTPGVTVVQGSSNYPDMPIDATGTNSTPFQIQTASNFACGTEVELDLNLTFPNGSKTIHITLPTCTGGADQTIPANVLDANDPTQPDRLGRDGQPSGCGGKACPGGGFPGTKRFQTFNFTNNSAAAACFTVTINAALGGAGDIESAAYLGTYDPTNLCLNYLGDSGISGLGTSVGSATYSFTVPGGANFVVVVNTTGTIPASSEFSGTVSGFVDDTAGSGPCPTP
jgi:hypothetical protein